MSAPTCGVNVPQLALQPHGRLVQPRGRVRRQLERVQCGARVAFAARGEYLLKIGQDPSANLDEAVVSCKESLRLDPSHAAKFQARYTQFSARWTASIANWEKQAGPLKGAPRCEFLVKPFSRDELGRALDRLLAGSPPR